MKYRGFNSEVQPPTLEKRASYLYAQAFSLGGANTNEYIQAADIRTKMPHLSTK